jgi:branched-chain amino acid transport system permease protein
MSLPSRLAAIAAFLVLTLVGVPWFITASGRSDLYYTLTSVALLSIASGGVWLTFYIGRINIGQGAYALMGGYVSAILVVNYGVPFWLTLPVTGSSRRRQHPIGVPILRLRGVFRHGKPRADRGGTTARPSPSHHQRRQRHG